MIYFAAPEISSWLVKMLANFRKLKLLLICLPFILLNLFSCVLPQSQPLVIREIIYPREVPASFETMVICRTDGPEASSLRFQWSSDNGTIKGNGRSIKWTAPDVLGTYTIRVKVTDMEGAEATGNLTVKVVSFNNTLIEVSPDINLQYPLWGNNIISHQSSMTSATTAEISNAVPFQNYNNYKYMWSCNGGKMQGTNIKEGTASKIGWISPGVPGYYTITVTISDEWRNEYAGALYFNVLSPCCSGNVCGGQ